MNFFDLFKKKEKTYICARCKKEITIEKSEWIGNHRFCSNCASPLKSKSSKVHSIIQTEQKDIFKKYTDEPLATTYSYAYEMVAITHKLYTTGNSMSYFMLLNGLGRFKIEVRPGEGHNYYLVVDAIHSYQKNNPNMNVQDGYVEGILMSIYYVVDPIQIRCIFNYLSYELEIKKEGSNAFEIDILHFIEQLISIAKEKQSQLIEKMPDFQEWFDKQVEYFFKNM